MKWNATVLAVMAALTAGDGSAEIYQANHPPVSAADEINGSQGAGTARSFAGAARMSHKFYSGQPAVLEDQIIQSCKLRTPSLNYWPESCNPEGMDATLSQWYNWVAQTYPDTGKQSALNLQVSALKSIGSPNIIPIYGEADHWVSMWKVETNNTTGDITKVHFMDGGPGGQDSAEGSTYIDGFHAASGLTWKNVYHVTIWSVGPADPYYNKYVNMYEPPPDFVPPHAFRATAPASPLRDRDVVTPALVRDRALDALRLAKIDENPELWSAFQNSRPGLPFLVSGVWPDGSNWDYYLVPFRNQNNLVTGMAILDSEQLTFQMVWAIPEPRSFGGFSKEQARQKAMANLLPGESLGNGMLTWDPAGPATSPTFPYYEFPIHGERGQVFSSLRVRLDTGHVTSRDACMMSRRLRLASNLKCASN
jgi:hypothetical protein